MSHDDFDQEPINGLPELPPKGEEILWQGRPDWWALTKESLSLNWVIGYFIFLFAWRFVVMSDQYTLAQSISGSFPFIILGAIVSGLLIITAYVQARATVYTITNRRVAMRIGAALTVTLNLPYTQIANATLDLRKGGTGTIALELIGDNKLSYLVCWPHVRPWAMRMTQPALRCIPDAANIAHMLSEAAEKRVSSPVITRAPAQVPAHGSSAVAAE